MTGRCGPSAVLGGHPADECHVRAEHRAGVRITVRLDEDESERAAVADRRISDDRGDRHEAVGPRQEGACIELAVLRINELLAQRALLRQGLWLRRCFVSKSSAAKECEEKREDPFHLTSD